MSRECVVCWETPSCDKLKWRSVVVRSKSLSNQNMLGYTNIAFWRWTIGRGELIRSENRSGHYIKANGSIRRTHTDENYWSGTKNSVEVSNSSTAVHHAARRASLLEKQEVENGLEKGVWRPSYSEFSRHIVLAKMKTVIETEYLRSKENE